MPPQEEIEPEVPLPTAHPKAPITPEKRSQPWKKHWSPNDKLENEAAYGFKVGEVIAIWGN